MKHLKKFNEESSYPGHDNRFHTMLTDDDQNDIIDVLNNLVDDYNMIRIKSWNGIQPIKPKKKDNLFRSLSNTHRLPESNFPINKIDKDKIYYNYFLSRYSVIITIFCWRGLIKSLYLNPLKTRLEKMGYSVEAKTYLAVRQIGYLNLKIYSR